MQKFPNLPNVLFGVLLALVLVVGCNAADTETPSFTSTILSTSTATPLAQTSSPNSTPLTHQSTSVPSTATPVPTITPTPYPTLSPTQVEANLIELLESNAGCQFPCLWGITPGLTRWQDAEKFLVSKGLSPSLDYIAQPPNYYDTVLTNDGASAKVLFYEQEDIVEVIELKGEGNYVPEQFKEMWAEYAPENILPTYGPPSRILVYAHPGRTSEGKLMYSLWFFYDQQGFLIHYGGRTESLPTLKLCPTFEEPGNLTPIIDVYLTSPNFESTLESLTVIPENPNPYINLEEAASMSADEFYELFQEHANPFCINVPRDKWE